MPLWGIKSCLVKVCFEVPPKRVEYVLGERSESGREFQTLGADVRKEREPKTRLVRGTSKRLEE